MSRTAILILLPFAAAAAPSTLLATIYFQGENATIAETIIAFSTQGSGVTVRGRGPARHGERLARVSEWRAVTVCQGGRL